MFVVDVPLILGELLKHRKLIGFLEATESHPHRAGFGGNDDNGTVCPEGCRDRGHTVGNTRAILPDDDSMAPTDPGIPVCHVGGTLFMNHRYQLNTCRLKNVHGVHEGAAHDAKDGGHAVGHHGFDKRFAGSHPGHVSSNPNQLQEPITNLQGYLATKFKILVLDGESRQSTVREGDRTCHQGRVRADARRQTQDEKIRGKNSVDHAPHVHAHPHQC